MSHSSVAKFGQAFSSVLKSKLHTKPANMAQIGGVGIGIVDARRIAGHGEFEAKAEAEISHIVIKFVAAAQTNSAPSHPGQSNQHKALLQTSSNSADFFQCFFHAEIIIHLIRCRTKIYKYSIV